MPKTRKLKLRHRIGLALAAAGISVPLLLPGVADASVSGQKFYTCASARWKIVWNENANYDTYVYDASSNLLMVGYGPGAWYGFNTSQPKWVLEIQRSTGNVVATKTFPSSSSGFDASC